MEAYVAGLEKAQEAGQDLSKIHSVASFFVSRVDTEIDNRLNKTGASDELKGKAGRRQRPARLRGLREVLLRRALGPARGRRRQPPAAALGLDRREEPRLQGHDVRRRPGRREHRQHDAREDPRGRQGPRRDQGRPGAAELRRRPRGDEGPRRRRHRLRRRHRHPREGGRREVREVLERAARDRREEPRGGQEEVESDRLEHRRGRRVRAVLRLPRRGRRSADAVEQLVADGVASGIAARDATLWGPEAESEAGKRLAWVGLAQESQVARRRDRRPARRARRPGLHPRRAVRHGRLLARARGHLRHPRRRADRAGLLRPRLRTPRAERPARAHHRGRLQQVRRDRRDRQPEACLRAGVPRRRPRAGRPHHRRHRPGLPARRGGRRGGLPRLPRRPRRGRPLLRAHRVRAGAERAGRCRHRAAARRGGRDPAARSRPTTPTTPGLRLGALLGVANHDRASTRWSWPTTAPASPASATGPSS